MIDYLNVRPTDRIGLILLARPRVFSQPPTLAQLHAEDVPFPGQIQSGRRLRDAEIDKIFLAGGRPAAVVSRQPKCCFLGGDQNQPLRAPEYLAGLQQLVSNQVPNARLLCFARLDSSLCHIGRGLTNAGT
jgi:hypothetical protein